MGGRGKWIWDFRLETFECCHFLNINKSQIFDIIKSANKIIYVKLNAYCLTLWTFIQISYIYILLCDLVKMDNVNIFMNKLLI